MGTIQDMNNRIKQNRAQRPSKRPKFKGNNCEIIYSKEKKSKPLIFKTVPEERLTEIKKQIKKLSKKNQKEEWIIYGIFINVGVAIRIGVIIRIQIWLN